jgi:hypothetical protein
MMSSLNACLAMTSDSISSSPLLISEGLMYPGSMPADRPAGVAWAIAQANPLPQHERLAMITSWLSRQFPDPAERKSFLDALKLSVEEIDDQMVGMFYEIRQALKEINETTVELRHDEIGPQMLRELRLLWEQVVEDCLPKPIQAGFSSTAHGVSPGLTSWAGNGADKVFRILL